jgi:hypothetical protein
MKMAQIKGMAILGMLKFVKETAGREQIAALLPHLSPAARAVYEHPILAGNWYAYEAYASLLAVVTVRLGDGRTDFPPSLGRFAARHDTGSIFKIVTAIISPRRALHAAGFFWSRYCDTGRFVMSRINQEDAQGHIEDFPGISAVHEQLLTGWIEGVGAAAGAVDPHVELVGSVHHGAPRSEYTMRWRQG